MTAGGGNPDSTRFRVFQGPKSRSLYVHVGRNTIDICFHPRPEPGLVMRGSHIGGGALFGGPIAGVNMQIWPPPVIGIDRQTPVFLQPGVHIAGCTLIVVRPVKESTDTARREAAFIKTIGRSGSIRGLTDAVYMPAGYHLIKRGPMVY